MFLIAVLQAGISYSIGQGPLRKFESATFLWFVAGLYSLRVAVLVLLVLLWVLKRRRALFRTIVAANSYFTLGLLFDVTSLIGVLGGSREAAQALLIDAALMSLSNIFIFSIWYWIIDLPGLDDKPHDEAPWAFLFPQRGTSLPHYGSWSPGYADYLFIGFTTSFAFSPTDTLPLTGTAKMLMLLQGAISVVVVIGIAAGAINGLVGGG
jgi:hypothetical protein